MLFFKNNPAQRKKAGIRMVAALVAGILLTTFIGPVTTGAASSAEIEQQVKEAINTQASNMALLDSISLQKQQLSGTVSQYTGELAWLNTMNEQQVALYKELVQQKEAALKEANDAFAAFIESEKVLAAKETEYRERLQVMFEYREKPILLVFLESGNLQGFFSNIELIKVIADYDQRMLEELEAARDDAELKRQDSLEKQAAATALVEVKQVEIDVLKGNIQRSSESLAAAQAQLAEQKAKEDQVLAQSEQIAVSIRQLQDKLEQERYKEEEERKRREAEERARLEAEERARQAAASQAAAAAAAAERTRQAAAASQAAAAAAAAERARLEAANQAAAVAAASQASAAAAANQAAAAAAASQAAAAAAASQGPLQFGQMIWPVPSSTWISSYFQPYGRTDLPGQTRPHLGLDIAGNYGIPIVAAADGIVILVNNPWEGWNTGGVGYGNYIIVDHGSHIATLYGHLRNVKVTSGQRVLAGDVIGLMGSTGNSTGPHLHFEVRVDGNPVDPLQYIGNP